MQSHMSATYTAALLLMQNDVTAGDVLPELVVSDEPILSGNTDRQPSQLQQSSAQPAGQGPRLLSQVCTEAAALCGPVIQFAYGSALSRLQ